MASEIETLEEEKKNADFANVQQKGDAKDKVEEEEEQEKEEEDTVMAVKEDSQNGKEPEESQAEEEEITESNRAAKESTPEEKAKRGSSSKDPVTPIERPTRERKMVERYTESSSGRGSASKPLSIEKGRGTQLKDIPNVAFKLTKRKPDDNLQILHNILFGKRTKAHNLKKNIGMFSGYLWVENEEKQRAKVKEKLDKCVKEKLLDFCDVLNIPINKTTIKKEDLCTKLLEFLESPHATTENLLSDKEKKGNKRKGKATGGKTAGSVDAAAETPTKKLKKNSQVGEKRKRSSKIEEEDKVESVGNGDGSQGDDENDAVPVVESDQEESKSEPEEDPSEKNSLKKNVKKDSMVKTGENSKSVEEDSPTKSAKAAAKSTKKSSKASSTKKQKGEEESEKDQNLAAKEEVSRKKQSSTKKHKVEEESEKDENLSAKEKASSNKQSSTKKNKVKESEKDTNLSAKEKASSKKQSSTKKNKVGEENEKDQILSAKEKTSSKKQSGSSSSKKDQEKGKRGKKAKEEPSREEMHAVAVDILKEVDFNTATLSDIVKQLGTHFGVDLTNRKAEVKAIIAEVISNMTDDDEEEESDGGDENKAT